MSDTPTMKCGHPAALAFKSVESDTVLCELCEAHDQQRDAESEERRLRAEVEKAQTELGEQDAELIVLRAEVERLTRERDEARASDAESIALYRRARERSEQHREDAARLREALRDVLAFDARTDRPDVFDRARAALAGAPVETNSPKKLEGSDRALAERVRSRIAALAYDAGRPDLCDKVRALDLDALMGQGEP